MERRNRRGAQAVEFALLSVVFMVLLLGVVDYGLFFEQANQVTVAAGIGARDGAADSTDPVGVAQVSCEYAMAAMAVDDVTCTASLVTTAQGQLVQVHAERPYTPLGGGWLPVPELVAHSAAARLVDQ